MLQSENKSTKHNSIVVTANDMEKVRFSQLNVIKMTHEPNLF